MKKDMSKHQIAVIAGDGIGPEVVDWGVQILERAGGLFGFELAWTEFPWGCRYYRETGRMMPEDGIRRLAEVLGIENPLPHPASVRRDADHVTRPHIGYPCHRDPWSGQVRKCP